MRKGWSVETLGRRMVYLSLQLGPGAFRVNPQALMIGAYVGGCWRSAIFLVKSYNIP